MTASDALSRDSGPRPVVSVVLPVYNGTGTIVDTIASVLQQTLAEFELIIIDDGSTDETLDMIAQISDGRIRIFSFENKGLPASRNRGIMRSAGEFVAFIDADDLWMPEKLERQVTALIDNRSAGLAYSWTDFIDDVGEYLHHGSHVNINGLVYEQLLTLNFLDSGSSPLVRRSVFDDVGLFDESRSAAADWQMWLRIACKYPFVCVPAVQIMYRVHAGAMSSSIREQEKETLLVFREGLGRLGPSGKAELIRKEGTANLYRYLMGRVVHTSSGWDAGRLAAGYLWEFWKNTPAKIRNLPYTVIMLAKIVIVTFLPAKLSKQLIASISLVRRRGGIA